jgi:hypothetical protein
MLKVTCVVACSDSSGVPSFFRTQVQCTKDDLNNGRHYDVAKAKARESCYSGDMVVFDENDGPQWLFDHMCEYRVHVNNIGEVYSGNDSHEAHYTFDSYADSSKRGIGRGAYETVVLFKDDEEIDRHEGTADEILPHDEHGNYDPLGNF